jgi:hypothetical protein
MDSKNGSRVHTTIPDFDPTATGNRSYTIGTWELERSSLHT